MADDPLNSAFGTLDQDEIDQLLAQAAAESKPALLRTDGTVATDTSVRVEPYDFRNPAFLTEIELRRLRIVHEDFIRYLASRLSLFLRMECSLKMSRLHTATYARFTESLANPTHICLFKAEPLLGVGVLEINPRLALTLVDRVLGGRGHSVKAERYLTEIEIVLLEDVLRIIFDEWCAQWKEEQELSPHIIGHENNGRFLQSSPADAVVLVLAMECAFGDCSEQLQIGLPYYTIEPLVKGLQHRRSRDGAPAADTITPTWSAIYENIELAVQAEWSLPDLPLREVAAWRVGDLLELPPGCVDRTWVLLSGLPKFIGTAGVEAGHVAISLSRKLTPAEQAALTDHG
jgi:flagellar motor switch protein FliM